MVQVHSRQHSASLPASWEDNLPLAPRLSSLGQYQAQTTLDQAGQSLTAACGFPFRLPEEGVIESNRGSHMSRHTI